MLILLFILLLVGNVDGAAESEAMAASPAPPTTPAPPMPLVEWAATSEEQALYQAPAELYYLLEDAKAGKVGAIAHLFDWVYRGIVPSELFEGSFLFRFVEGKPVESWSRQEMFAVVHHVSTECVPFGECIGVLRRRGDEGDKDALALMGILLVRNEQKDKGMPMLQKVHDKKSAQDTSSLIASYYLAADTLKKGEIPVGANGIMPPAVISYFRQASLLRKDMQVELGRHYLTPKITGKVYYEEAKKHFEEAAKTGCYLGYYELAKAHQTLDDALFSYARAAQKGHEASKLALRQWLTIKPRLDLYEDSLTEAQTKEIQALQKSLKGIEKISSINYKVGGYTFLGLSELNLATQWYLNALEGVGDSLYALSCLSCENADLVAALTHKMGETTYITFDKKKAESVRQPPKITCLPELKKQLDDLGALVEVLHAEPESKRISMIKGIQAAYTLTNHYLKPWVEQLAAQDNTDLFIERTRKFLAVTSKELEEHIGFVQTLEERFARVIEQTAHYRNARFRQSTWW